MTKKGKNKARRKQHVPIAEQLSPRVLYSADPFGLSSDIVVPEENTPEQQIHTDGSVPAAIPELSAVNEELLAQELFNNSGQTRTEVIVVNTSVADYQQIVEALTRSSDDEVTYVIHTLHSSQSISDVDQLLAEHQQLDAIHFITHGDDANFNLGSSTVNSGNLSDHSNSFEQWGASLTEHGDILFYGCNLAETAKGQQLVADIANATNADVGASDNRTGHISLNADWQLEFSVGQIDTDSSRMENILNDWESQLEAITVTTTIELTPDGDTSSATSLNNNPGPDGEITLREAVAAANADNLHNTIYLPAGTYNLDSDSLDISNTLTILGDGPATIITTNFTDRVINIQSAGEVTLSNLTITEGEDERSGGGIYADDTQLTLESVNVTNNKALQGGGIYLNSGSIEAYNVEISGNFATDIDGISSPAPQGGGLFVNGGTFTAIDLSVKSNIAVEGGGAFINGLLTSYQSDFTNNNAVTGGGLYVNGEATVADTLFQNNKANLSDNPFANNGGAVFNDGTTTIERSLLDSNKAERGAAIHNGGTTTITNSTLAHNESIGAGSAVRSVNGLVLIESSTIADNKATAGTSNRVLDADTGGAIAVGSSLIARNTGESSDSTLIDTPVTSNGYNLTDTPFSDPQLTDTENIKTGLSTDLGSNGGHVNTYELLPDSPAINKGAPATTSNVSTVDSTGAARGALPDIGAFEFRDPDFVNGPSVVTNNGLIVSAGEGAQITPSALAATDPDTSSADIVFTVIKVPTGGKLSNNGAEITAGGFFTQADIFNGDISYQHIGSRAGQDSFLINVSDGTNVSQSYQFDISILGPNAAPVLDNSETFQLHDQTDVAADPPGTSVSDILQTFSEKPITDDNLGSARGIAINGVDNVNGTWEFKVDPADAAWSLVEPNGTAPVGDDNTLLLETTSLVRFVPNPGFTGTAEFMFRAHDWSINEPPGSYQVVHDSLIGNTGAYSENIGTAQITISVPEKPTLTGIRSTPIEINEGDTARIFPNTVLADNDDTHIESATVSITSNFVSEEDILSFTNQDGITGNYNNDTGKLTFTGSATLATYEAALQSVTYENTSEDPSDRPRTVSLTINDGDSDSDTVTRTINLTAINDAPELSSIESFLVTYNENTGPLSITGNLQLADFDDVNIESATISISAGFETLEDKLIFNGLPDAPDITGFYNSNTGVLELSGSATVAQYQAALTSVEYLNNSKNPSPDTRTVSFTINDGDLDSNTLTRDIDINPVDNVPVLSDIEPDAVLYTEQGQPIKITNTLSLADIDSTTLTSAWVAIHDWDPDSDVLNYTPLPAGIVAEYNAGIGSLLLEGSASIAEYQSALRSITYESTSDDPSDSTRTVSFSVSNMGNNSTAVTRDIVFTAVNDRPVLSSIETLPASFIENSGPLGITNSLMLTDADDTDIESATISIRSNFADAEDKLVFINQRGISGSYDATNGVLTLTGSASVADYQAAIRTVAYSNSSDTASTLVRTVDIQINDGDDASNVLSRNIDIVAVNDAPTGTDNTLTTNEDTAITLQGIDFGFSDSIDGDVLAAVTVTTLPANGTLALPDNAVIAGQKISITDIDAGDLIFTPLADGNGTGYADFDFLVHDDGGNANGGIDQSQTANTITIDINPVNDAPETSDASLPTVAEDSTPSPQPIASLVNPVFSDIDSDSLAGIAITANLESPANGQWQFATPTGNNWQNINDVAPTITESNALLLASDNSIRFLPAPDYNGTPIPLDYKVVDSSFGNTFTTDTQATVVNTLATGNDAPFSNIATLNIEVTPVNDAPVANNASLAVISEDNTNPPGESVAALIASTTDVDTLLDPTHTPIGIAVTQNNEAAQNGNWQYSDANGVWQNIGSTSSDSALVLDTNTSVRFLPAPDYFGTPQPLVAHVIDSSHSSNGLFTNALFTGGTTPFSNQITVSTTVTNVNDAPVIADVVLQSLTEDINTTEPMKVVDLFASQYSDTDGTASIAGIAVTANPLNTNEGTWQYSTDGSAWYNINAVSDSSALLIKQDGYLRFSPAANFHGDPTGLTIRALDGTFNGNFTFDNANRKDLDVITAGTIVSDEQSVSITILAVNDAPTGGDRETGIIGGSTIDLTAAHFGFSDPADNHNLDAIIIEALPQTGHLFLNNVLITAPQTISATELNADTPTLTYTADIDDNTSTDELVFRVVDSGGTSNGGENTAKDANRLTIVVNPPANTPPESNNGLASIDEDTTYHFTVADFNFSDPVDEHSFDSVQIVDTPQSGTLKLDNTEVEARTVIPVIDIPSLSYTPAPSENGLAYASFDFKVIDDGTLVGGGTNISVDAKTFTFDVTPVNDAPTLSIEDTLQIAENTPADNIGRVSVEDVDNNDTHQFSVSDNRFEVINGALALKPGITLDFETEPQVPLQISVTDSAGESVTNDFVLQVLNINEAPVQVEPLSNQTDTAPYSFTLSETVFRDVDGDELTTTATLADGSPLPDWLTFEDGTFTIEDGAPAGPVNITATATDPDGLAAFSQMTIEVQPAPEPPAAAAQQQRLAPLQPVAAVATAPEPTQDLSEPEVVTEDTENSPESDNPPPTAELIDVQRVQFAENRDTQRQLPEVIQLNTLNAATTEILHNRDDIGIVLTNEFNILLAANDFDTNKVRQQTAFNAITLNNLATIADQSRSTLAGNQIITPTVVAASVTLTSSFSVGYILWLLRGGTLLASVMASMPAWRAIDPLPILESLKSEDDGDTETLQSMVEDSAPDDPEEPQDTQAKSV